MDKHEVIIPILTEEAVQQAVEQALIKYFSGKQTRNKEQSRYSNKPMSIEEACKFLGISKPTMYNWLKAGVVKVSRIKGRIFFTEESLIKVIKDNEMSAKDVLKIKSEDH